MKAIVLASLLGGAAGAVVVNGTINYSSPFKLGVPIDGAFNVLPSVANIWQWTGPADGSPILVDIDGDGVMDTSDPKVKVVITDVIKATGWSVVISGSSGPTLEVSGSTPDLHLTTPWVLPTGSDLFVNGPSFHPTVTLIGRVQNL